MQVTVKLFATLRKHLPPGGEAGRASMDLAPGATVEDLVKGLGIPGETRLLVLVNAVHAEPPQELEEGDVVAIFPPLAGG